MIDVISESYKNFLCCFDKSLYFEKYGMKIFNSGFESKDTNICFIEKISSFEKQKEAIDNKLPSAGLIFSPPSIKGFVGSMSNSFSYMGKVGVVQVESPKIQMGKNKFNTNRVGSEFTDIAKFINKERGIDEYFILSSFEKNKESMRVYAAYIKSKIVGVGYAIQKDNAVFILDTIVTEEYRNSGVLTEIGEVSMAEAVNQGIKDFISIVSSQYSQRVAEKMGYEEKMILDLWSKE